MSFVQVKSTGGGRTGVDRTSFVGARTPLEIRRMIKPLLQLDKAAFKSILKVVISVLKGNEPSFEAVQNLINEKLTQENLSTVYCGVDKLVRLALKTPSASLKKEFFMQDLEELQIPVEFREDLGSVVFGPVRAQIDEYLESARPRLPSLENLDWRVDVAISTGVLNRVLVRNVTMDMALSDGSLKNFEMSISKFQDLRFQVTSVLSEMEKLEKRSILKIKD